MQKYKKVWRNFWLGSRKDASNHFNVSPQTIQEWFVKANPDLMFWLEDELTKRKEAQIRANDIKNNLLTENAPAKS